jgi:hypothetical protein
MVAGSGGWLLGMGLVLWCSMLTLELWGMRCKACVRVCAAVVELYRASRGVVCVQRSMLAATGAAVHGKEPNMGLPCH